MKKLCLSGFYIHGITAVIAMISLGINWQNLEFVYVLMHILVIAVSLHQFEEHYFPGGFDFGYNYIHLMGKKNEGDAFNANRKNIDRYPANKLSFFIVDSAANVILLVMLLFFRNSVTATFCGLFGLMETMTHTVVGIIMYRSLKNKGKETIYNPGAGTSWGIFLPIGILIFHEIISNSMISGLEWLKVIVMLILFMAFVIQLPERGLMNPNSPYPFEQKKFRGYYERYLDMTTK